MSFQANNAIENDEAQQDAKEGAAMLYPSDNGRGNTPAAQVPDSGIAGYGEPRHNTKIDDGKSFTERLAVFRAGCDKLFTLGTEICALLKEHFPEANFCLTRGFGVKLDNSVPSDLVRISPMDAEGHITQSHGLIGLCVYQGRLVVCETSNGEPSEEQCDARSAQQVLDDFFSEENMSDVYNSIISGSQRRGRNMITRF